MSRSARFLTTMAWCLAALALPVHAEPPALPRELGLQASIDLAREFNPGINEARERVREQEGTLTVSRSSRRPDLEAFGLYQVEDDSRSGSFGGPVVPDDEFWRYGARVTQPLYFGGVLSAAIRSRTFELQARQYALLAVEDRVIADVHRKYFDALLAREIIVVRRESLDLLRKQLQLSRNRFEAGAGAKFDVLQAEVRVANAQPPLIRAENEYITSIDDLRTSLGVVYADGMTPADIRLTDLWNTPPQPVPLPEAIATALTNRPDMQNAIMQREAAREWVYRTSHQRSPRLDLFADYTVEYDRYAGDSSETLEGWMAGVEASWSIWDGGRIRGETAQAQSQYDQAKLREQALRLAIELDVRTAWNQATVAKEILEASTQVIAQADEAVRLAENRYSAGAITQLDVLSSQLELTQAKLEKITAERNYTMALIDLQRATGTLPRNGQATAP